MEPQEMFGEGGGFGFRARRGALTPTILRLLLEKPMHGYEIISTLAEKTHGMWRPSPGAVYPTLQLLEEQELVTSEEKNGKRVYSLTPNGHKLANQQTEEPAWKDERIAKLRRMAQRRAVVMETISLMRHIALTGKDKDIAAAEEILKTTNEKLSKLVDKKE